MSFLNTLTGTGPLGFIVSEQNQKTTTRQSMRPLFLTTKVTAAWRLATDIRDLATVAA